jgi:site-specific DNA-adenine methylase
MFNYFGSKFLLAKTYQTPKHDVIVEPFAGSAQYAMYWMRQRSDITCILYDTDPMVIKSWNRMLAATPDEIVRWEMQVGDPINDYIDKANYGGHNKIANDRIVANFYSAKYRWARTRAATDGRVVVIEGDYTQAPDIEASWFVDPPYQHQGHHYEAGNDAINYTALSDWCQTRKGQVIVCEASPGDWLPFRHHRIQNTNLRNTGSQELVWYSHPEPTLLDLIS